MKRIGKRIGIGAMAVLVLYFGVAAVASRNSLVGLFFNVYAPWIPLYDVIEGPRLALNHRAQYNSAVQFITGRMLTPSTAHFCALSDAKFGTDDASNSKVMIGWVDAQNGFGAMIRQHFEAFYGQDGMTVAEIHWAGERASAWR